MKHEPKVIKELREAEKLGLYQSKGQSVFKKLVKPEETFDDTHEKSVGFAEDGGKREQKKREIELKVFKTVADISSQGIGWVDIEGIVIYVNKTMANQFEDTQKNMIGKNILSYYPKCEQKRLNEEIFPIIFKKGSWVGELPVTSTKGKIMPTIHSLALVKDENGEPAYFSNIITDISEQKKREKEIKESEAKFKDLFENSSDIIQIVDSNGKFIFVNKKWKKSLGYSDKEIAELHFTDILRVDQHPHCMKMFEELSNGNGFDNVEVVFVTKSGNEIFVVGNINTRIEDGKFVSTRGIFHDVTEQKKIEQERIESHKVLKLMNKGLEHKINVRTAQLKNMHEELKELNINLENKVKERTEKLEMMNSELIVTKEQISTLNEDLESKVQERTAQLEEASNKLNELNLDLEKKVKERTADVKQVLKQKDEFVNQLSHDLKNPLGPIVNLLPIVVEDTKDPNTLEVLEVITRNAVYMKSLVMDTLALARLDAKTVNFDVDDLNLLELIINLVKDNETNYNEGNIKAESNLHDKILIKGDELRIKEVINNLTSNSIKYMYKEGEKKEGGKIIIDAMKDNNFATISVTDTGIGMTKEQASHVFEEFYKADKARHDMASSGLGLNICQRIISKHGGKIWVESEGLGKGTTTFFTIPLSSKKLGKINIKEKIN